MACPLQACVRNAETVQALRGADSLTKLTPAFLNQVKVTAKREGVPRLEEWTKRARLMKDTVQFMIDMEKNSILAEVTQKGLYEELGRDAYTCRQLVDQSNEQDRKIQQQADKILEKNQKIREQERMIETLSNIMETQDVASYMGTGQSIYTRVRFRLICCLSICVLFLKDRTHNFNHRLGNFALWIVSPCVLNHKT